MSTIGVAVIGCGASGARRARTVAADTRTALRVVVDNERERAVRLATELNVEAESDWRDALARPDIGCLVVCTPIALLIPIGIAALRSGRHVLIEKPLGRNATEARTIAAEARRSGTILKAGFNSRYRPALVRAHELVREGAIGRLMQLSCHAGDCAAPDVESRWRANAELAGGGELLATGVDVVDLFHWFAGPPVRAQADMQSALWDLGRLEDNAFGLLRFRAGVVGLFHVSSTEWRPRFHFEANGDRGTLTVSADSEGTASVRLSMRDGSGPEVVTVPAGAPSSWAAEWTDFAAAMHGAPLNHGHVDQGLQIMATIDALYAAARSGSAVGIGSAAAAHPAP